VKPFNDGKIIIIIIYIFLFLLGIHAASMADLYRKLDLGLKVLEVMYLEKSRAQVRQIDNMMRLSCLKMEEIILCTNAYDKYLDDVYSEACELYIEVRDRHLDWLSYYYALKDESYPLATEAAVDWELQRAAYDTQHRMALQDKCYKKCIAFKIRVEDIMDAIHFSLVPVSHEEVEKDDCAICLGPFDAAEPMLALACNHVMHDVCIKQWIKTDPTCPMCRTFTLPAVALHED
jgi:hypothetical protein